MYFIVFKSKEFGEILGIRMTEPKSPLVPKKLAYIKFKNQSSAAKAYENCDPGMMASRSKL